MHDYYAPYGWAHPARMVVRQAGREIERTARTYLTGRLLDIGCGDKSKHKLIGHCVQEYVGLDHPDSIHGSGNVDLPGTAYAIPAPDGTFDSVLCTAVLEHLEEPAAALQEAWRVLRPGGHALYTVPLFWHIHEEPRDFYRYTEYGLRHLFRQAGFSVVELRALSGFWLTFGSEWSYYLGTLPGSVLAKPLIAMNNLVFPALDALDRRWNRQSSRWTWLYLIAARKA